MPHVKHTATVVKPVRNYQRELEKLAAPGKNSPPACNIELELATRNPVSALPFNEFVSLLRLAIESHDFGNGCANTKTTIEMRLGLSMLVGGKFDRAMPQPFDWSASIQLLGPFLAFIYQRMHAEVRMLDTVELPEM